MADLADLYDQDFYAWTQREAAALRAAARAGSNLRLDWENLAEEIESLGRSDLREVRNRLRTIIEHLLKLEFSSAQDPRPGWEHTVERSRQELEDLLRDSPSLRRRVPSLAAELSDSARALTARELAGRGEVQASTKMVLTERAYTPEQVQKAAWFPTPPAGTDPD